MDKVTGQAQLLIKTGGNSGKKIPLNATPFCIGRDLEVNYIDNGPGISRKHCQLIKEHGAWWLEDLGSSNGVIVNGKKVGYKTRLYFSDRIAVGETVFLFEDPENKQLNPALNSSDKHIEVVGKGKGNGMGTVLFSVFLIIVVGILAISLLNPSNQKNKDIKEIHTVSVMPVEITPAPIVKPAYTGHLPELIYFNSNPPGATVYLNGEVVGKTPLPLTDGYQKVNNYKIELYGYVSKKGSMVFPVDKPNINVELEQRPGTIVITSIPTGASVYHGRHIIGKTPLVLKDWKEGEYELKINDFGYTSVMKKITVSHSEPTILNVKLAKYTRKIVVISSQPDCDVYVDGVFMGKTQPSGDRYNVRSAPLVLEGIKPGGHSVKVESRSGEEFTRKILRMPEDKPYNIYADVGKRK